MAAVIIALGSNMGDRLEHLSRARAYLKNLSENTLQASAVYVSEPVGPSERDYYNAAVRLHTDLLPHELLKKLKEYERRHGRDPQARRWSARTIDLDIIGYDDLVLHSDTLIIPHPEYRGRSFVLLPLRDINPGWKDPESGESLAELMDKAPDMKIRKTELHF